MMIGICRPVVRYFHSILMAFHICCSQAAGPPVQNEPVDLSVRAVAPAAVEAAQVIVNGGKSINPTIAIVIDIDRGV